MSSYVQPCSADLNDYKVTGLSDTSDRTLRPQCPVVSSKLPKPTFADRTRPVMPDRTLPASGHAVTTYYADRQHDQTQPFSVRSLSDPASGAYP